MGIIAVQQIGSEVIEILKSNGHNDVANELSTHIKDIETSDKTSSALNEIIGLCHVRNMGDLNINKIGGYKWWDILSKLEKKASQTLKSLPK